MVPDEGQAGFTLLETLIAFLILSVALAISAQTLSVATRSLVLSNERNEVLRLADSLRAETFSDDTRKSGEISGQRGRLRWSLKILPVSGPGSTERNAAFSVLTISSASGQEHKFVYFGAGAR